MMYSKHSGLSDEELLTLAQSRDRTASPLMAELINRLEKQVKGEGYHSFNPRAECPVCEAPLQVDPCQGNLIFNLTVDKDAS